MEIKNENLITENERLKSKNTKLIMENRELKEVINYVHSNYSDYMPLEYFQKVEKYLK